MAREEGESVWSCPMRIRDSLQGHAVPDDIRLENWFAASMSAAIRMSSRPVLALVLSGALFGSGVPSSHAADAVGGGAPGFQALRFEENWSRFDPGSETSRAGVWKRRELSHDGDVWLGLGGQFRQRLEVWNNFNFGAPSAAKDDDTYLLSRVHAHADLHLGRNVRVFAEALSALSTSRDLPGGRRTLDVDQLDLQNGFVEWNSRGYGQDGWRLRAGRQKLLLGSQRLVSPLDWANTRRQFDGVTASWAGGDLLKETGASQDVGFGYLSFQYTL